MKPQNETAIIKAYYKFALYLILSVIIAVLSFWLLLRTCTLEMNKIEVQAVAYEEINKKTQDLVNSVDTTYNYIAKLYTSPVIDNTKLRNLISTRKIWLQKRIDAIDNKKDCSVYAKIVSDMDKMLKVRDSIGITMQKEDYARQELMKCQNESRINRDRAALRGIR